MRRYQQASWLLFFRAFFIAGMLFTLSLLILSPARAESSRDLRSLSLEELMEIEVQTVSSTSKYLQKVSDAPSSITVITADDIRTYGYRTLADILAGMRGFASTYDRSYRTTGVRGFGQLSDRNSRILLLVDGHRLNDNVTSGAPIGSDFILDIDLIDRIEVSRGPGSSLYGSNAFFAIVNVITRRGQRLQGGELSGVAGSFRSYKGRLSYGVRGEAGKDLLISGTAFDSRGDRLYFKEFDPAYPLADVRAANGGFDEYHDADTHRSAFIGTSAFGLTLSGAASSRKKDIATASSGADFNVPGNRVEDRLAYLDLRFDRKTDGGLDVTARVYLDAVEQISTRLYGGIRNRSELRGNRYGTEVTLGARFFERHHLVAGTEYEGGHRQDMRNYDELPFVLYEDSEHRSRAWAAYLQDEITLGPSVLVNAGVRYDDASTGGSIASPRAAAIITPGMGSTLKLLYGSAFRSPSASELHYESPASAPPLIANPNLKPEKIRTYELVYERALGSGLNATLDGYIYHVSDLIDQTVDAGGNLVLQNIDEVKGRGIEVEIEKRWTGGTRARVSGVSQEAVDERTDVLLSNSPRYLGTLHIAVPFAGGRVVTGLEGLYTGRRRTASGRMVGDFMLTNLTFSGWDRAGRTELSFSIYNLFDVRVEHPVAQHLLPLDTVVQEGRTLRLKVTYAF